jgi:hypothetical protein
MPVPADQNFDNISGTLGTGSATIDGVTYFDNYSGVLTVTGSILSYGANPSGPTTIGFKSADGSEFSLQSIDLYLPAAGSYNLEAYRDGVFLGAPTLFVDAAEAAAGVRLPLGSMLPNFLYIDEFRISFADPGQVDIDTLDFEAPVVSHIPPVITNLNFDDRTYLEGQAPVAIDVASNANVTDADTFFFNGGSLSVSITAGGVPAEDVLGINTGSGVSLSGALANGATVFVGATAIGTVASDGANGNPLTISFNANATAARVTMLLRAVTYANSNTDTPTGGSRTLTTTFQDGDGQSDSVACVVQVGAVNDAPVNTVPGAQTVAEDTDLAITGLSFSDIDVGAGAIVVVLSVQHGTIHVRDNVPGGVDALGILFNDTDSVTISGAPALVNATLAALNGVIYRGDVDYVGPDTLTMLSNDLGNTGGSSLNDIDTVNITVTPVNDSPDNDEPGPSGNAAFLSYTENQAPTAIDPTLSFFDPDDPTLVAGRVTILSGFHAGEDVLGFHNDGATMGNIAVAGNVNGALILASAGGTATVAEWNNALRAVTYFNASDTPSTANRLIGYEVDDGDGFVPVDDATIGITAVNDAVHDFNGDGKSDILFQHADGSPAIWLLNGTSITAQAMIGANPGTAWHAIGSGDINGDEKADILFQHDNGTVAAYQMNGTTIVSQAVLGSNPGTAWHLIASGDLNGDHKDDLIWQHDDGSVGAWLMNGNSVASSASLGQNPGPAWNVIGTGDFNGDGKADILWQHDNGTAGVWLMDGTGVVSTAGVGSNPGAAWHTIGAGDFNGDGKADILWQHDNGTVGIWLMNGTTVLSTAAVGTNPGPSWNVIGAFDVNGDGRSDILFQHDNGQPGVWLMDGFTVTSTAGIGSNPGPNWNIAPEHDLVV